jgi:hypothetical protein
VAPRFPPVKVIKPDSRTISAYKLSGTPETILVSSEGVVLKVWNRVFVESMVKSEKRKLFLILIAMGAS